VPGRDFTKKREPVWFDVGDDRYVCHSNLIADDMKALMETTSSEVTVENVFEMIEGVFKIVMTPEAFQLYAERKTDRNTAFDHEQLMDILQWLIETYTKRPTTSPSSSSTGSPNGDTGSGSTAGASDSVSIQDLSTSTGFLT